MAVRKSKFVPLLCYILNEELRYVASPRFIKFGYYCYLHLQGAGLTKRLITCTLNPTFEDANSSLAETLAGQA
jgi:hypothetical protein